MAAREKVIAETLGAIDAHLRCASIAQIGGFRPPESPVTSWFGGHFVGLPGQEWPTYDGQPMLPLLQVRCDELPYRPPLLNEISLFNVFIGPREIPIDLPAPNGQGWEIRTFPSLDGLVPIRHGAETFLRPFPIRWSLSGTEGLQWEDAWHVYDLSVFNQLSDCIELFGSRYNRHYFTKVGGWPSYIQASPGLDSNLFVFQIGSEEKPRWMWGDNGTGLFYLVDGKWLLYWDCY